MAKYNLPKLTCERVNNGCSLVAVWVVREAHDRTDKFVLDFFIGDIEQDDMVVEVPFIWWEKSLDAGELGGDHMPWRIMNWSKSKQRSALKLQLVIYWNHIMITTSSCICMTEHQIMCWWLNLQRCWAAQWTAMQQANYNCISKDDANWKLA